MAKRKIIVGARGSLLSVAQAQGIIEILKQEYPAYSFSLKKILTSGDRSKNWQRDDTGIFVKEIEQALLSGEIDLAVHSMKDLPTRITPGLKLAAVTKREDPRDCLICCRDRTMFCPYKDGIASGLRPRNDSLFVLKRGASLGTSSLRRRAQLLHWRPDLQIKNLRGNLDTRLRKLTEGEFNAIAAALAGLIRLGYTAAAGLRKRPSKDFFIQPIPVSLILPAPGQGTLAIEVRDDDKAMENIAKRVNDRESFLCALSERAFLRELGGGCRLPLGALAEIKNDKIHLKAVVASPDGKKLIRLSQKAPLKQAESLGKLLAKRVLAKGGRDIMKVA